MCAPASAPPVPRTRHPGRSRRACAGIGPARLGPSDDVALDQLEDDGERGAEHLRRPPPVEPGSTSCRPATAPTPARSGRPARRRSVGRRGAGAGDGRRAGGVRAARRVWVRAAGRGSPRHGAPRAGNPGGSRPAPCPHLPSDGPADERRQDGAGHRTQCAQPPRGAEVVLDHGPVVGGQAKGVGVGPLQRRGVAVPRQVSGPPAPNSWGWTPCAPVTSS